jgi:hypothetical protein
LWIRRATVDIWRCGHWLYDDDDGAVLVDEAGEPERCGLPAEVLDTGVLAPVGAPVLVTPTRERATT